MRIHTTEKLGPKQSMTPAGFLLCRDVPIARTGEQLYYARDFAPNPPPIEPAQDGTIRITRDADEVFHPDTIASFEGAPITIGHTFVNPINFRAHAVGHMQNVRRGTGVDTDLLMADFLIHDAEAIAVVRGKVSALPLPASIIDSMPGFTVDSLYTEDGAIWREVSCGYDAEYEQTSPGRGRQKNIVGNHVALVERARAGARCAIKDEESTPMKTVKERIQAILAGIGTRDAELEEAIQSMDDRTPAEKAKDEKEAKTADSIAKLTETTDSLTANMAKLIETVSALIPAPPAEKTVDAETEDSKQARAAVGDAMTQAEILVPGFKAPAPDTIKTMADVAYVQRSVLAGFAATADGAALLTPMLKGRTVDSLSEDAVSVTFGAAAVLQSQKNNSAGFVLPVAQATKDARAAFATADNMNQAAASAWAGKL